MRRIKSKGKAILVRRMQKPLALCLIVSAVVLGLLANSGAVNESAGIDPSGAGQQPEAPFDRPSITGDTVEVLSYQDSGYRFLIIGPDATPPPGFQEPDFRPVGFSVGPAAFGSDCGLKSKISTNWDINTQLLVRRKVSFPPGATNVRVMVSVDNDIVALFFNGTLIAQNIVSEGCAISDQFRINVAQELVRPHENLVVYWLRDRGGGSFFDTRILAELARDDFSELIRRITRAVGAIVKRVPTPPMTNIRVTCDITAPTPSTVRVQKTITFNVNNTGHAGRIEMTMPNLPSTETTTTGFIENTPIFTCTRSTRARSCERSDTPVNMHDVAAMTAVVAEPVVRKQLSECMVNVLSRLPASNRMARNVKSQQSTGDEGCPSCREDREIATFECDDLAYNCLATCIPQVLDPEHPMPPPNQIWCEWCDDRIAQCQETADQTLEICNRGECFP